MASAASRLLTVLTAAREGAKVGGGCGIGCGWGGGGPGSQGTVIWGALERRAGRIAAELAPREPCGLWRVGVYTCAQLPDTGNSLHLIT